LGIPQSREHTGLEVRQTRGPCKRYLELRVFSALRYAWHTASRTESGPRSPLRGGARVRHAGRFARAQYRNRPCSRCSRLCRSCQSSGICYASVLLSCALHVLRRCASFLPAVWLCARDLRLYSFDSVVWSQKKHSLFSVAWESLEARGREKSISGSAKLG
jgi:hypothetical protein